MSTIGQDAGILADVAHGRVPVISWTCGDDIQPHSLNTPLNLVQIANGLADTDLATIRTQLLSLKDASGQPYPFILRYFWEFNINASQVGPPYDNLSNGSTNGNGNCFITPGSQTGVSAEPTAPSLAKQFIDAWNHVHQQMQGNQPIPNLTWDWNPNVQDVDANYGVTNIVDPQPYYPGNGTVDWIGVDGYSKLTSNHPKNFGEVFSQWYNEFSASQYNKPMMIGETASCQYYGKFDMLPDQLGYIQGLETTLNPGQSGSYPMIHALLYFDAPGAYDPNPPGNSCTWSLDSNVENMESISPLQGFTTLAGDSYFASKIMP
jgi:hypothetical protein